MPNSSLKAEARRIIKENAPMIFLVCIIFIIITTVLSELSFRFSGANEIMNFLLDSFNNGEFPTYESLYSIIIMSASRVPLAIVASLISFIVEIGFIQYCMKISRAQSGDYKDLVDGFFLWFKIILIRIISTFFSTLWSLLFIIPGIVASYRYSQAYYILLDAPEKGALQCIRESKQLMRGKKLDLFLLHLSFFGWLVLHVMVDSLFTALLSVPFAIPIVLIWLTPYFSLAKVVFYNQLINYNNQDISVEA